MPRSDFSTFEAPAYRSQRRDGAEDYGRWDPLFSEQHREAARWRLRQAGVEPPR